MIKPENRNCFEFFRDCTKDFGVYDVSESFGNLISRKKFMKDIEAVAGFLDSKNIKKHKNDVFRLGQLITAESRQALDEEIATDMKRFLNEMEKENIDLKALGIRGVSQESMISLLRNCYGIE